jgi:transcriptional regulator with XRE-family HTH domain
MDKIRELRKSAGMTQVQLAAALGVTPRAVIMLEKGEIVPSLRVLVKIREIWGDKAVLDLLTEAAEGIREKEGK